MPGHPSIHNNKPNNVNQEQTRIDIVPPVVVLIFGNSCAGKSTVGRELAGLFTKGAYVEVDELRQKIVGGHVGGPRDPNRKDAPDAHAEQRKIADENASILAQNFAAHGFSSVIEGLENSRRPGTGWSESRFGAIPVFLVLLMCDEETALKRLTGRGWGDGVNLRPGFKRDRAWYLDHQDLFDLTVRTDEHSPERVAKLIYDGVKKRQK